MGNPGATKARQQDPLCAKNCSRLVPETNVGDAGKQMKMRRFWYFRNEEKAQMDLKTLPYWFVLAVQQGGELASGGVAGCAEFAGNSFAFFNGKDAVNRGEFHALFCAGGPVNLRGAGSCAVSQAEVYA